MNIQRHFLFVLILVALSALSVQAQSAAPPVNMITADELKAKMSGNQSVTIIDVRSSEAYASATSTIKGAIHFKVRKLKYRLAYPPMNSVPKDREIITYCSCPKDEASIEAAQILISSGYKHVRVLQGGWQEWLRANGPVEARTKT